MISATIFTRKVNLDHAIFQLCKNPVPEEAALAGLEFLKSIDNVHLEMLDLGVREYALFTSSGGTQGRMKNINLQLQA